MVNTMVIVLVMCLIVISLYFAKRLSDANAENAVLRGQIVSLKKQLVRRHPTARA
jgi:hypothetical protein